MKENTLLTKSICENQENKWFCKEYHRREAMLGPRYSISTKMSRFYLICEFFFRRNGSIFPQEDDSGLFI